jgi:hypothetical protein
MATTVLFDTDLRVPMDWSVSVTPARMKAAMRMEPVHSSASDQAVARPPSDPDTSEWTLLEELQNENKRLRAIVVYLGEMIVRGAVER